MGVGGLLGQRYQGRSEHSFFEGVEQAELPDIFWNLLLAYLKNFTTNIETNLAFTNPLTMCLIEIMHIYIYNRYLHVYD